MLGYQIGIKFAYHRKDCVTQYTVFNEVHPSSVGDSVLTVKFWTSLFFVYCRLIDNAYTADTSVFCVVLGKWVLKKMISTFGNRWGKQCSALIWYLDLPGCGMKHLRLVGGPLGRGPRWWCSFFPMLLLLVLLRLLNFLLLLVNIWYLTYYLHWERMKTCLQKA